jgi:hypothetical protein
MRHTDDEQGGTARRVGWFILLWAGGVLAVSAIGLTLRAWLG